MFEALPVPCGVLSLPPAEAPPSLSGRGSVVTFALEEQTFARRAAASWRLLGLPPRTITSFLCITMRPPGRLATIRYVPGGIGFLPTRAWKLIRFTPRWPRPRKEASFRQAGESSSSVKTSGPAWARRKTTVVFRRRAGPVIEIQVRVGVMR